MICRATKGVLGTLQGLRDVALIVLLLSSGLLTGGVSAEERAQPVKIGVLTESWGPTPATVGLRDGLLELGYRENEQFVLGVRFTQGDLAALSGAARDLVQYGVDIIFSDGYTARAAQLATTRIPIVFAGGADPVGLGLIQSFARPGGNITEVTDLYFRSRVVDCHGGAICRFAGDASRPLPSGDVLRR